MPLGEVLGPLGEVLGHLGVVLGPLGAVRLVLIACTHIYTRMHAHLHTLETDLGPILRPKRLPKGDQNGAQNDPKSKTEFNIKKECLRDPPGPDLGFVLARFGLHLDVKNH